MTERHQAHTVATHCILNPIQRVAHPMPSTYSDIAEQHFIQGLVAARGGLGPDSCPYAHADDPSVKATASITAPVNWMDGWRFGRFTMTQALRRDRSSELQTAVARLFQFQDEYSEACRVSSKGLVASGLKSLRASRRAEEIAVQIKECWEYKLLHDLCYEFYLPWRQSEVPYAFRIYDHQLDVFGYGGGSEQTLRALLSRYGDRHGVRAAWEEYIRSEPLHEPTR